ncbi:hypothetical protein VP01_7342g1, partial [Puccinia sorghi]
IERTCESCAVSQITRGSFNSKHHQASKIFEEVHLDLVGPIWPSSREGHRYILTFVDSHSRLCSAISLGHTSDQLTYMLDIEAKRIGYYPSVIHSNQGTEFTNRKIFSYCKEHQIKTRTSDPHTPQHNGLAERYNQTILKSLRLTLHNSGMNNRLWNVIAHVISLTLNQIPSHKSKKSPFGLFKNHTLPLNHFHPIGNKVSYLILPEQSFSKIKSKGYLGRLIGYNDELPSFRILSEDGKIIETKHVDFFD